MRGQWTVHVLTFRVENKLCWIAIGSKRCGDDGAEFELTIGAAADPAAKQPRW
jgi:hypothetical protein